MNAGEAVGVGRSETDGVASGVAECSAEAKALHHAPGSRVYFVRRRSGVHSAQRFHIS